jgi:acyl carrier protein
MKSVLGILTEIRPEFDFTESSDFFSDGLLDSFDLMTLVSELDKVFAVSIDGTEIVPENFRNIDVINRLLIRHGATL